MRGDNPGGLVTGLAGRELAVKAHRHAFGLALRPGLDDVHFASGGIDADAEPRQLPVPEDRVLAVDREADVLVTGDNDLLRAGDAEGFQVLTPRGFWESLRGRSARTPSN